MAAGMAMLLSNKIRAFNSLRSECDYLTKIINAANEGIYVTDLQRRFIMWNEAAGRISGYHADEVLGRYCHDNILCHTNRQGTELFFGSCPLLDAVDTATAQEPAFIYMRHKDGRRIPVEVKTAPLCDDEGTVIGGVEIFEDITERLEKERMLTERREKLETVLDSISDGILFLDSNGSINVYNHALSGMLGPGKNYAETNIHVLSADLALTQALDRIERMHTGAGRDWSKKPLCDQEASGTFRCWTQVLKQNAAPLHASCYDCTIFRTRRAFLEQPKELVWGERTISVVSSFIELQEVNEIWEVIIFHDANAEKLDAALKVAGAAAQRDANPRYRQINRKNERRSSMTSVVMMVLTLLLLLTGPAVKAQAQNRSGEDNPVDCRIDDGPCEKTVGALAMTFNISPKPVKTMSELTFTVALKTGNVPVENATLVIGLTMPGMYMGLNNVLLSHQKGGVYKGNGVIVRCPSGKKKWKAVVTIKRNDKSSTVGYIFEVK